MNPAKPTKSFKKLQLNKETVQPLSSGMSAPMGPGQEKGAMSFSEYCSGSSACSIFYPCLK